MAKKINIISEQTQFSGRLIFMTLTVSALERVKHCLH